MSEDTKNETDQKKYAKIDKSAEALLTAAYNNNTSQINLLIQSNKLLLNHIYVHEGKNKSILLIACSKKDISAKTVRTLLDLNANPRDYTENDGWETLHWAANSTDYDTLNVLLDRNSTIINDVDNFVNNALHVLIQYGDKESKDFKKCVDLLIKKGISVRLKNMENMSPIEWAEKKLTSDIVEAMQKQLEHCPDITDGMILLDLLKQKNETKFENFKNGEIKEWVDYGDDNHTLLQMCCEENLIAAAKHLLNKGANHEITCRNNNYKPITLTVKQGNEKIFSILLEKYSQITEIPGELLPTLVKYIEYKQNLKCYHDVMNKIKDSNSMKSEEVLYKLNEGDVDGNTALHYAVVYAEPNVVEELLSLGASLGAKNKEGIMPIKNIDVQILRKHLDTCVEFDLERKKTDKEEFTVKFNYRTLTPPHIQCVARSNVTCNIDAESSDISLISTFRTKLVVETEVMNFMSETSELKELLIHPTITSYLYLKWLHMQWIFWTNLVCYVIFACSLLGYIYFDFMTEKTLAAKILYVCVSIGSLGIFVRELFQIIMAPKKYFTIFENYVELILVILSALIALDINFIISTKEVLALTVLLVAFELLLFLGHHPLFSTNVVMFRKVSYNFYKFLAWYLLPIIAFAVSFYLVFVPDNHNTKNYNPSNDTNNTNEEPFAQNLPHSFFKTVIMITGEFNSGDIKFDIHPVISYIIFLTFVLTIAIILLNLLNGLAVSDTQIIQKDAELVGYIERTQFITSIENILMGNISLVKQYLPLACIFPDYFKYEVTFFPRKDGLIDPSTDHCRVRYSTVYLDYYTVQRTNTIIQKENHYSNREMIKVLETLFHNIVEKTNAMIEEIKNLEYDIREKECKQDKLERKIDTILTRM